VLKYIIIQCVFTHYQATEPDCRRRFISFSQHLLFCYKNKIHVHSKLTARNWQSLQYSLLKLLIKMSHLHSQKNVAVYIWLELWQIFSDFDFCIILKLWKRCTYSIIKNILTVLNRCFTVTSLCLSINAHHQLKSPFMNVITVHW